MNPTVLLALRDLMLGGRHSRSTITRGFGVSFPTADRWLTSLLVIPGIVKVRVGKVTWLEWRGSLKTAKEKS